VFWFGVFLFDVLFDAMLDKPFVSMLPNAVYYSDLYGVRRMYII
jgi:hypothetical protein